MQVKIITEVNITDAVTYLNYYKTLIEKDFLLHKIRSGEFFVLGCYDDSDLLGISILTNHGHIACLHIRELWKNKGLEKLLFQEIYHICTSQLRLTRITASPSKQDIAMFSYLGFRIFEPAAATELSSAISMQFFISPSDIRPASRNNGLIIGLSIAGGCFILIFIIIFIVAFSHTIINNTSYYDDIYDYDSWDDYDYDDYDYGDHDYGDYDYGDYDYDYNYDYGYDDYNYGDYDDYDTEPFFNYDYFSPFRDNDDDFWANEPEEEEPLVLNPYVDDDIPYHIEESSFTDYYHDDETYIDFEVYYPQLIGTGSDFEGQINFLIRNRAMQNTEDFYLHPTEYNKEQWADNDYLYLSSLVDYQIAYMDEDFVSIVMRDHYFWGSIFGEFEDMYTLNINLKDGTVYEIADFINVDEDFTDMWIEIMLEEEPDCTPLLNLKSEYFTEMLLSGDWVDGRYYTNFFVSADGVHMELVYHYRDEEHFITRGWVNAPFPTESLTPYARDCSLWDLITTVTQ